MTVGLPLSGGTDRPVAVVVAWLDLTSLQQYLRLAGKIPGTELLHVTLGGNGVPALLES
ncbi:hypothetical protein IPZ68_17570 [Streptomyces arenae]|nr:hypothetical protein [Streptomyces arenae]